MTLLLQVSSHTQIPIIERALKLVKVFADVSDEAVMYKNHLYQQKRKMKYSKLFKYVILMNLILIQISLE